MANSNNNINENSIGIISNKTDYVHIINSNSYQKKKIIIYSISYM